MNTVLYVEDQVAHANSEDNLRRLVNQLEMTALYGMEISTDNTKVMAFCGCESVCSKIVVRNNPRTNIHIFRLQHILSGQIRRE